MVEVNKFKIGVFVIGGFIIGLGVIFLFGGARLFETKVHMVTLCRESVQGLEVGSQVKFKGVPIGSVKDISIIMSTNLIQVDMEIDPDAFIDHRGPNFFGRLADASSAFSNFINGEIKTGLKVRIEYAGITGLKYIEMNKFDGKFTDLIEAPKDLDSDEIYIQTVPSIFSDISKNISTSLENLSKVRFDKIAASLEDSLAQFNRMINDPAVRETLENLKKISNNVDLTTSALREITPERINEILKMIDENLVAYRKLAGQLNDNVMDGKIAKTIEAVREAGYSVNDSSGSLEITLGKLDKALDNLSALLQSLNENPSILIRGKKPQNIDFPSK